MGATAYRQMRADRLCIRLTAEIAGIIPKGIGAWGPAWEMVDPPTARFMELLAKWEATGDEELTEPIRLAYRGVVEAWEKAAEEFRKAGEIQGLAARGR